MRYAKIFDSIWEGSMRGKTDPLFVFVNLLTHSDEQGIVDRHWKAIRDETGLPEDRIKAALEFLQAPDAETKTPDEQGRRIILLDKHRTWGWRIVNHQKYRNLCSRTQNAERQARYRKNSNASVTHSNASVTDCHNLTVGVGVGVYVLPGSWAEHSAIKTTWQEWQVYRRKLGKVKCWDIFFGKQLEWLAQFSPDIAVEIINTSIRNGWRGLFELSEKPRGKYSSQQPSAPRKLTMFELTKQRELVVKALPRAYGEECAKLREQLKSIDQQMMEVGK